LGPDLFSLTVAVHSADNNTSYDWMDGVAHFRVLGSGDGVVNLNAEVSHRRLTVRSEASAGESINANRATSM